MKKFFKKLKRKLETKRLDAAGAEFLDPVPHATTLGVKPGPTMDERIRSMMRNDYFARNPNAGLESDDDNDFEVPEHDPMYEFERRYEELEHLKADYEAATKEIEDAKADYKKRRRDEALKKSKAEPDGTPAGSKEPKATPRPEE